MTAQKLDMLRADLIGGEKVRQTAIIVSIFLFGFIVLTLLFLVEKVLFFTPHGFKSAGEADIWLRPIVMAISTIAGIWSKAIYEELAKHTNSSISLREILAGSVISKSFFLSLTISPIIILSFYSNIDAIGSLTLVALISYENGFFFRAVMEQRGVHTVSTVGSA